jgi:uncharacterized RDD family membrane protein YckC
MLDTYREIETPEGVELHLRAAGPVARALAYSIDLLLRGAVLFVLSIVLSVTGRFGMGVFMIVIFLMEWFYPVLFEVYRNGETPGKRMFGLRVVNDNGTPVGWGPSLVRNLLRAVDFMPSFYAFGLVSMLLNRDFKRLGDLAAGTIVVYQERAALKVNIPDVPAIAPPLGLNLAEQRAVITFAERSQRLTDVRSEELADLLTPLTGVDGRAGIQRLYQMANWLVGKR